LEEAIQEDITTKVAQAPNVRANKVQALAELDSNLTYQLPPANVCVHLLSLLLLLFPSCLPLSFLECRPFFLNNLCCVCFVSQIDGIDLSILTSMLTPPEKLADPDVAWDFETLFTGLSDIVLACCSFLSAPVVLLGVSSEMQKEADGDQEFVEEDEEKQQQPSSSTSTRK
jgi:hypothetical protein